MSAGRLLAVVMAFLLILTAFCGTIFAERTPCVYYRASCGEKKIALTFDDGPHPRYTEEILSILAKEGVRATFFEIGSNIEAYPEVTKKVIAAGHEIGNHTYTHPSMRKISESALEDEIRKTDEMLRLLGASTTLFRPPQGILPDQFPQILERTHKSAILWNVDTRDWAHRSVPDIITEVEHHVHGGDIILFHDYVSGESTTVPAIKKLIPMLKEQGYQFVTVSELLSLSAGK